MQTLVIPNTTQRELCGSSEGGIGTVLTKHIEVKGGNTLVTDLTSQPNKIANGGIPTLTKLIESKNEMF